MSDYSAVKTESPLAVEQLLPPEIWEIILKKLVWWEVVRASCVCRCWRHLATRICRERCQCLPPRLLAELIHEHYARHNVFPSLSQGSSSDTLADDDLMGQSVKYPLEAEEPNWLDINRMYIQTALTSNPYNCSEVLQVKQVTHLASSSLCHGDARNACCAGTVCRKEPCVLPSGS
ncbi:hypothetical protein OTU49_008125 [Cherax quadricarinatus]|uniref:F-box domain-containing protein n=1 Tax=Cherax quadricarinatus TaxID=27406 RepID=A0AAW0WR21_CHEQU